ncbi:MAG: SixA phosphatase family protein [Geminicoccaceae bacterium]
MRRLLLLRHGKSSWDTAGLADLDRPLAPRGRRTAPLVAQLMVKRRWVPDLVFCSQAERVRETWQLMAPLLGEQIPVKTLRTIYPGAPSRLLMTLRRAPDEAKTLLLIGHNPGLGALATSLCGAGSKKALATMRTKFPTAGLAVIDFDLEQWSDVTGGAGRLEAFVRPKDLD